MIYHLTVWENFTILTFRNMGSHNPCNKVRSKSQNNFIKKPQVVQHPVEAPYLHYEEGCHSVIVPSCGFFGHRVLWGRKWYVT